MIDLLIHLKFIDDIETPVSYKRTFTEKCFQNSSFVFFFDGMQVSHLTVLVAKSSFRNFHGSYQLDYLSSNNWCKTVAFKVKIEFRVVFWNMLLLKKLLLKGNFWWIIFYKLGKLCDDRIESVIQISRDVATVWSYLKFQWHQTSWLLLMKRNNSR